MSMQSYVTKLGNVLFTLLFFLIAFTNHVKCQVTYQDSLRNIISTSSSIEQKLDALRLLGREGNSLHADSLQLYASETQKLAITLKNEEALLDASLMQVGVYNKNGEPGKAIELADKEIAKKYTRPNLRYKQRRFYLSKGFVLNVINKTKEAQETFFTVLSKAENEKDILGQAVALNGIGWSYSNLNNIDKAIEWYKKGLGILKAANLNNRLHKEMVAVLQSNIGLAYYPLYKKSRDKKFADSASFYLDLSIHICRKLECTGVLAISLGTRALLLMDEVKDITEPEKMLLEAINIRKKLGQLYFIIADMSKLSEMYYQSHNYKKSIIACTEAIRLADSSGIKSDIIYLYEILARTLRADGQYEKYGDILAVQIRVQDSIDKVNTQTSLNELTVKYEVQKKEAVIAKQEYHLFKRKILLYTIIICVAVLLIIAFFKFRQIQKRQKDKLETERRQAMETERLRITSDLHDDIGATLSSMYIYGDLAKNVWDTQPEESKQMIDKISTTSKDLMGRMGDIIWSMKPAGEDKYSFTTRLKNYCTELLSPKNIHFKLDIDESITTKITNPEARKNILLITKEAVNNIAKYSNATQATVSFKKENDDLLLLIGDNGKGFDTTIPQHGNGLQNIEHRCRQLNGETVIISEPGQGATISCRFPMATISYG
ncbi:MAG: hypothetical protein JNM14_09965 [Ferruginibacter sp.]|nr:hypothetical protein [Ferruginibacter sp.]